MVRVIGDRRKAPAYIYLTGALEVRNIKLERRKELKKSINRQKFHRMKIICKVSFWKHL